MASTTVKPGVEISDKFRLVILVCSCMCTALTWGTLYSCGVFFSCWTRQYPSESKAFVSLVGALPLAVGCGGGPLYGAVIGRWGCRRSTIAGGLVMSLGLIVSSLMSDMRTLLVTFGLMTGLGAGLANFAGSSALNEYFIKDRVIAEGASGSSLCVFLFIITKTLQKCIDLYTWRGALLIAGGFNLFLIVFGMFLLPPEEAMHHPLNFWRSQETADLSSGPGTARKKPYAADINGNPDKEVPIALQKVDCEIQEVKEGSSNDPKRLSFMRTSALLWRRTAFLLLLGSHILAWMASFVPYVHLVERARLLGMDEDMAAWISSSAGIGGAFGRILVSYIFQKSKIHPFYAYGIIQIITGVITILSPFWSTISGLFVFAILFGISGGAYGFMKASVSRMLGKERYVIAFSWLLLFEGIGIGAGPTIGGMLYAHTQSYSMTFFFSGSVIFLSGIFCIFKNTVVSEETKTQRQSTKTTINDDSCL